MAEIASQNSPLIVRAQMPTTESGFLKPGLAVKLKFDAYPFQDYGIIEGKLAKISPTTSLIDTPNGKVEVYKLEISFNRTCLKTANQCIPLHPGDTATAEVVIRQRRIIDFVLDPFKKLQKGGLKL
jgi:HlyD family secretion protein